MARITVDDCIKLIPNRKNILRRTGKTNISDVIYDLLESGVI